MRKIVLLLIVCLLGSAQLAEAQLIRSSQTVITKTKKEKVKKEKVKKEKKVLDPVKTGLQQEISVAVGGFEMGDVATSFGVDYTIGYRFNNTLFIGGGLGLGLFDHLIADDCFCAQFFGDIRAYLTKTRVQPYFDLSLGGIYKQVEEIYGAKKFDIFAYPQFGINWRLNNRHSLNLTVGYKLCFMDEVEYSCPQVKIGFSF